MSTTKPEIPARYRMSAALTAAYITGYNQVKILTTGLAGDQQEAYAEGWAEANRRILAAFTPEGEVRGAPRRTLEGRGTRPIFAATAAQVAEREITRERVPSHTFANGAECFDSSPIVWANAEDCLHG